MTPGGDITKGFDLRDIGEDDVVKFFDFLRGQGYDTADEQQCVLACAELLGGVIKMYDLRLKRPAIIQDDDLEILTTAIERGHGLIKLQAGGH
jgi:hypothetical protein